MVDVLVDWLSDGLYFDSLSFDFDSHALWTFDFSVFDFDPSPFDFARAQPSFKFRIQPSSPLDEGEHDFSV